MNGIGQCCMIVDVCIIDWLLAIKVSVYLNIVHEDFS
jgi:hypothetical protein